MGLNTPFGWEFGLKGFTLVGGFQEASAIEVVADGPDGLPNAFVAEGCNGCEGAPNGLTAGGLEEGFELGVVILLKTPFGWAFVLNGFDIVTLAGGFQEASAIEVVASGPDGLPNAFMVEGCDGCEGVPNGLTAGGLEEGLKKGFEKVFETDALQTPFVWEFARNGYDPALYTLAGGIGEASPSVVGGTDGLPKALVVGG